MQSSQESTKSIQDWTMVKVSGREEDPGPSVGPNGRIDYDEVLKHVGQMGKFQTWVFLLLCLVSALSGLAVFAFGFTGNYLILEPQNIIGEILINKIPQ